MTTAAENEMLTRVGPGTPMGELMRQYWIPALQSTEIEAGCDPIRLKLLGEELIAYRDEAGRALILEHHCPHRRASLFFGRVEADGIRCIYHGWKFDAQGHCVDMPNVESTDVQKSRVQATAYKTHERNGLVWVFMGDQSRIPALPALEANLAPGSTITMVMHECNWLQTLEGAIDTSHVGFLHCGSLEAENFPDDHPMRPTVLDRAPKYQISETAWGAMYGAYRPDGFGKTSWRVAHFAFPFWTTTPNVKFSTRVLANGWVPLDDTHTMLVLITGGSDSGNPIDVPLQGGKSMPGGGLEMRYLPRTSDWLGRWRPAANKSNDYLIDRVRQRANEVYTGVENILTQDQVVTEGMGPIHDRTKEHLNQADVMVVRARRRLLEACRALSEEGKLPPAAEDPSLIFNARGGCYVADPDVEWMQAFNEQLAAADRWPSVEATAQA
jgi:phthalate 4,5-dioxygenase oxygenase subunit